LNHARNALATWFFLGNSSQMHDADYWEIMDPNYPTCGTGTDLPYDISIDASTKPQLQHYLSLHTDGQTIAIASNLRPEQGFA